MDGGVLKDFFHVLKDGIKRGSLRNYLFLSYEVNCMFLFSITKFPRKSELSEEFWQEVTNVTGNTLKERELIERRRIVMAMKMSLGLLIIFFLLHRDDAQ